MTACRLRDEHARRHEEPSAVLRRAPAIGRTTASTATLLKDTSPPGFQANCDSHPLPHPGLWRLNRLAGANPPHPPRVPRHVGAMSILRSGGLPVDGWVSREADAACVLTGSVGAPRKCECVRLADAIDWALLVVSFVGVFYNWDDLTSASDVQHHCRTFEKLKTRRIAPKFGRLANVTTVASVDMSPPTDLAATIRTIVREELQRQVGRVDETIPHPPTNPPYYTAAPSAPLPPSVCVADISETGNPRPRRDSFAADQRYGQRLRHGPATQRWAAPAQQARHRSFRAEQSQHWFGERPLPVCYNCGFEVHIASVTEASLLTAVVGRSLEQQVSPTAPRGVVGACPLKRSQSAETVPINAHPCPPDSRPRLGSSVDVGRRQANRQTGHGIRRRPGWHRTTDEGQTTLVTGPGEALKSLFGCFLGATASLRVLPSVASRRGRDFTCSSSFRGAGASAEHLVVIQPWLQLRIKGAVTRSPTKLRFLANNISRHI
ncbi:hypothetical protein HPB51_009696 [Rhipicephalus microplus]|uniref:Uncharacterized protein n=1 Tax=Rhipicephalus microplus TaxID=6941 RepID=A0A9J6ESU6_RHIMP|nr:hypothetical protein HPB51_009696 [Rhipicephalus microplus]